MKKMLLLVSLLVILLFSTGCMRIISTGEVGVKKTLGHINPDEIGEGVTFFVPIMTWVEKVDVKTQEIKESASVPSSEGLIIKLEASTIYKIDSTKAAELKGQVSGDYVTTLLEPYIRSTIRDIVSGYEAKSIYAEEGRHEVEKKVREALITKLNARGIIIEDFLLRDIVLPDAVTTAIQTKLSAEQNAQKKEFDLLAAKKDAEIKIVEAGGIAEANKIIANSLTENYITYSFIQTLKETTNRVIYVPFGKGGPILTRETGG